MASVIAGAAVADLFVGFICLGFPLGGKLPRS
jgi:hypothetical protein